MITAYDIEQKTGLHNVTLEVSGAVASITSTDPIPEGTQVQVQKWYDAKTVDSKTTQVRNAQLRQWLIDRDLDELVEAKLSSALGWSDVKTWKKAKSRYEYEPNVNRHDPLVDSLGHDLGMDEAALDAAFEEIALIP
jgi:hypothetical protein